MSRPKIKRSWIQFSLMRIIVFLCFLFFHFTLRLMCHFYTRINRRSVVHAHGQIVKCVHRHALVAAWGLRDRERERVWPLKTKVFFVLIYIKGNSDGCGGRYIISNDIILFICLRRWTCCLQYIRSRVRLPKASIWGLMVNPKSYNTSSDKLVDCYSIWHC